MDDVTIAANVDRAMRAAKRQVVATRPAFPGVVIEGFDVEQLIGSGGQGCVFKAVQRSTGRAVAIKVLLDGRFVESRARRRFEREAQLLASLNHPHVVCLLDQGCTSGGAHYLAMPFIDGITLEAALKDRNFDPHKLLRIFAKIARAVHACHCAGVVHRDLKPTNIIIDGYDLPHILDFGMARSITDSWSDLTRQGCDVGSLLWASPEQLRGRGKSNEPTADVYSLGVMLYQVLHEGRLPYKAAETLSETLQQILEGPLPRLSKRLPLNDVLLRAMHRAPHDRFQSAAALADGIEGFPITPWRRVRTWRTKLAGSIGVTLILMLVLVLYVRASTQQSGTKQSSAMLDLAQFTNPIGMRFVKIPAGDFQMGLGVSSNLTIDNASLHHAVISKHFWISTTETTTGQWASVMEPLLRTGQPSLPIDDVDLAAITRFCMKLSLIDHKNYRLPTEEEWEYVARAGSRGPWGPIKNPDEIGWTASNAGGYLHDAASLRSNAWGVFDMVGNVGELCSCSFNIGSQHSPQTGLLVRRGGSYLQQPDDCTVTRRLLVPANTHSKGVGFRLVVVDQ